MERNGRDFDPTRTPGGAGVAPPPDAPIETTQPLHPDTIAHQLAQARANEKELKPFKPPQRRAPATTPATPVPTPPPTPKAAIPGVNALADAAADFFGEAIPQAVVTAREPGPSVPPHIAFQDPIPDNADLSEVDQMEDLAPLTDEDRARMPAASDSESPSRGILQDLGPDTQSRKAVSGGFGMSLEGQYNPLDGNELRELILSMFDELVKSTENDLRFSMALTYPRVQARVLIEVEGYSEDEGNSIRIERVRVPKGAEKGATPKDVARSLGQKVVFVVLAEKQEFTPDGESDQPPDAIREGLGLTIPRMTMVPGIGGDPATNQQFVDIASPGLSTRALMRG